MSSSKIPTDNIISKKCMSNVTYERKRMGLRTITRITRVYYCFRTESLQQITIKYSDWSICALENNVTHLHNRLPKYR